MSTKLLNSRPDPIDVDGQPWYPAYYVWKLEDALRDDMRDKSELRGYMATIRDLWSNIPENLSRMPYAESYDSFRKHGLIKTGWANTDSIVFDTAECARKGAIKINYMARMGHGYAITRVQQNVVVCAVPMSQSLKAMGKEDFAQSRADVLDFCRGIVGVQG